MYFLITVTPFGGKTIVNAMENHKIQSNQTDMVKHIHNYILYKWVSFMILYKWMYIYVTLGKELLKAKKNLNPENKHTNKQNLWENGQYHFLLRFLLQEL